MKRRRTQTILFGIVTMLSIGIIVVLFWIYTQQRGYLPYTSKTAGFSLSYPNDWSFSENKNGADAIFYSPVENDLDFFQENVNIVTQDLSAGGKTPSLREYTDMAIFQIKAVFEDQIKILESQPASLAGHSAHKLVYLAKGPEVTFKYMHIWTIIDGKAYQFTYMALSTRFDSYWEKVRSMLWSFKIKN